MVVVYEKEKSVAGGWRGYAIAQRTPVWGMGGRGRGDEWLVADVVGRELGSSGSSEGGDSEKPARVARYLWTVSIVVIQKIMIWTLTPGGILGTAVG